MNIQSPQLKRFGFKTDAGEGARARLGVLVLESDQTLEPEFARLLDLPGVATYHARLANAMTVTPETLAQMAEELPKAAGLLPTYLGVDAIGYGCTSGATVIGEARVEEIVQAIHPGVKVTNPITAAKAALGALGVQRIGLLTPYTPDVTGAMQANFQAAGFEVSVVGSFYEESDAVVGKISQDSITSAAVELGQREDVDGVFISCTSLRASPIIEGIEATLGKPVTASNHALAWHLMRIAGVMDQVPGAGRLFQLGLSA